MTATVCLLQVLRPCADMHFPKSIRASLFLPSASLQRCVRLHFGSFLVSYLAAHLYPNCVLCSPLFITPFHVYLTNCSSRSYPLLAQISAPACRKFVPLWLRLPPSCVPMSYRFHSVCVLVGFLGHPFCNHAAPISWLK